MALGDHLYNNVCDNLNKYPGNYLEIGVFDGDGFARVASAYPEKTCYAIDPFIEDGYTISRSEIERGNQLISQKESFLNLTKDLKNIQHYELTSVDFFKSLTDQQIADMSISYVVIDGSHHYNDVVNDYHLALRLLSYLKSGIILFDDLHVPDVKQAYDEFKETYAKNIELFAGIGGNADFVKINL